MGYNRSGKRRTQRMKRAKREHARLAAKATAVPGEGAAGEKPQGFVEKVKGVARGVADAVSGTVKSAVEAVTGKKP